jgi:hypothetical protein
VCVRRGLLLLAGGAGADSGLREGLFPPRLRRMPPALSDDERAQVGAMWAFRARGEHEIAAQYADLARRLRIAGASPDMVERVTAASADEARHRDLCAAMTARLQHAGPTSSTGGLRRIAPHPLDGPARLAYEMVALFCVTESINATLLLHSWRRAKDEATRETLHALLADEVEHSRIGWGYLAALPAGRDEIAAGLPRMLSAATHDEHFLAASPPYVESAALTAHGLLPVAMLRGVFLEAMNDVVFPGLELCGVATGGARGWLAACTSRWTPPAGVTPTNR